MVNEVTCDTKDYHATEEKERKHIEAQTTTDSEYRVQEVDL